MSALVKKTLNAAKTLLVKEYEGGHRHIHFWCPACRGTHFFSCWDNNSVGKDAAGRPVWSFDENLDCPTFNPSLRYLSGTRCHLFLHAGVIEYCGDCPHGMAGQKVPLLPIPEEYREHGY